MVAIRIFCKRTVWLYSAQNAGTQFSNPWSLSSPFFRHLPVASRFLSIRHATSRKTSKWTEIEIALEGTNSQWRRLHFLPRFTDVACAPSDGQRHMRRQGQPSTNRASYLSLTNGTIAVDSTTAKLSDTAPANHGAPRLATDPLDGPEARRDHANEALLEAPERAAPLHARVVPSRAAVPVLEAVPAVRIAMCLEDTRRDADPEA